MTKQPLKCLYLQRAGLPNTVCLDPAASTVGANVSDFTLPVAHQSLGGPRVNACSVRTAHPEKEGKARVALCDEVFLSKSPPGIENPPKKAVNEK